MHIRTFAFLFMNICICLYMLLILNCYNYLSTDDGIDYNGLVKQVLSFSPGISKLCVNITILDDDVYEEQNDLFGVVLPISDPVVTYIIENATVTIINSDREE